MASLPSVTSARSIESDQRYPQLRRMQLSKRPVAEKIVPGTMLMLAASAARNSCTESSFLGSSTQSRYPASGRVMRVPSGKYFAAAWLTQRTFSANAKRNRARIKRARRYDTRGPD